ncbi:MAG: DegV family protein [Erysipelotrichaceae bacterium]|nr:DegV family protein [Erysipelotrichaceae bacterium]
MKKWKIVVDSSSDIRKGEYGELVEIIPMSVIIGDKTFIDNDDLSMQEVLDEMNLHKEAGSTACPAPGLFYEAYKGAENVLCFSVTAALSGTYNSAVLAKNMIQTDYPNVNIYVMNTRTITGMIRQLVLKSIEMINENKTLEEMTPILEDLRDNSSLVAIVGGYDNLVKTGRINPLIANLAGALNVKAILTVTDEGTVDSLKKVHGIKVGYKTLANCAVQHEGRNPIIITHCMNEEGALQVKELIQEQLNVPIEIYPVKSLLAFYLMEGGVVVSF